MTDLSVGEWEDKKLVLHNAKTHTHGTTTLSHHILSAASPTLHDLLAAGLVRQDSTTTLRPRSCGVHNVSCHRCR